MFIYPNVIDNTSVKLPDMIEYIDVLLKETIISLYYFRKKYMPVDYILAYMTWQLYLFYFNLFYILCVIFFI